MKIKHENEYPTWIKVKYKQSEEKISHRYVFRLDQDNFSNRKVLLYDFV